MIELTSQNRRARSSVKDLESTSTPASIQDQSDERTRLYVRWPKNEHRRQTLSGWPATCEICSRPSLAGRESSPSPTSGDRAQFGSIWSYSLPAVCDARAAGPLLKRNRKSRQNVELLKEFEGAIRSFTAQGESSIGRQQDDKHITRGRRPLGPEGYGVRTRGDPPQREIYSAPLLHFRVSS